MRYVAITCAIAGLVAVAGCNRAGPAHGDVDSIIVLAIDSLWAAAGDDVERTLEPRIFTVRNEKTFELTHVSPMSESWLDLRGFKQVLVIGTPGDGWVQPVLDRYDGPVDPPAIIEQRNVWARGQLVTAIVVPPGSGAEAVSALLPEVGQLLDDRFREYALSRMFLSGADSALADSLRTERGYTLLLPGIYRRTSYERADVFRNVSQVSGVLVRTIFVGWRPGLEAPTRELALVWRDSASTLDYEPQHEVQAGRIETREVTASGHPALEVQGVWSSKDATHPAAGPFIARVVPCPDQNRTYFLDAWVYAPGRAKYEYMIQLHTLLDSFRCGAAAAAPARAGT